jgi:hypothetical protein
VNPNDVAPLLCILMVCVTVVLVLRGPVGHALGRWIDRWGRRGAPDDPRVADVEARIAELEAAYGRTLELEERLEFAERLLAQARTGVQLEGGR